MARLSARAKLEKLKKLEDDLASAQHKLEVQKARLELIENREKSKKVAETRRERTHKLIVIGATMTHYMPQLNDMSEEAAREYIERIFSRASAMQSTAPQS